MAKRAFLFPGQGAQFVGMGQDIYQAFRAARDIFDRSEAVTALPIKKLCFEGPKEQLDRTDIAQPAIFTVSAAMLGVMNEMVPPEVRIKPDVCAGLSLGEYTALYAAGAMDFETALKLVARRGELMQQAAVARPSGMLAVIGLDEQQARRLCEAASEGQVLTCANFNCPGQIVLSGEKDACQRAAAMAEQFGAKAVTPLKVAGAFHSEIMAPAGKEFAKTLPNVHFSRLNCPVIANVDATEYSAAGDIPKKLLGQLTGAIRWEQSMRVLLGDGVEMFYEIGPGKVLGGLMRRINRKVRVTPVNSTEAVERLTATELEEKCQQAKE